MALNRKNNSSPARAAKQLSSLDHVFAASVPKSKAKADAAADPAWRYRLGLVALGILLALVFIGSFWLGRVPVPPLELLRIFGCAFLDSFWGLFEQFFTWQQDIQEFCLNLFGLPHLWLQDAKEFIWGLLGLPYVWPQDIDSMSATAVLQVRLPRIAVALFVGAALSIAGASYQGLFQNPMVSQDILGASSGAAFGAALAIMLGLGAAGITSLAFELGLAAVALAYGISRASKLGSVLAMILAGMVVSALFSAATSFIKLVADTENVLPAITYWLMGSLNSVRQADAAFAIPVILIAAVPVVVLRWRINLLATGEEEARSLGINVRTMRLVVIICATLLTATCVSVSGLIGWVGLIIPHFCRLMFGYDYRRLLPASILLGATFLIVVDDVARLAATSEIPIGILTAVIGAPLFIFLMLKGGLRYGRR